MRETLAYDDVLLSPRKSEALPRDATVESVFTPKIKLRIPFCSAAMDTVSGEGEHPHSITITESSPNYTRF